MDSSGVVTVTGGAGSDGDPEESDVYALMVGDSIKIEDFGANTFSVGSRCVKPVPDDTTALCTPTNPGGVMLVRRSYSPTGAIPTPRASSS